MRPTHTHPVLALATLTLLLAGCGTQGGGDAGGSGTVSPSPTKHSQGCGTAPAELGTADAGRTYCLATGGELRLSLDGTAARPWTPVKADGNGLEATNSGIVLQPGDASAAFRAVSAGIVHLTSSRPLCATEPHRMSCKGLQEWTVTVRVTKP
ncbi:MULTISPECIES: hypothetical protein [unclassified Streptomyces]|uniref:hypothetical protein n=1 Tax=unclassified Streptomyces TaxID=2593676 RepID=UPI0037F6C46D|nr:hypothetical protein OG199_15900 [Streptomyces sp. NBC_01176]